MHRRVAVPKKYDHINFVPPEGVANAAARGLELRAKASPSNRGGLTPAEASKQGIGSGVQRAVNLKNRDPVSPKVVKQMRGFLSRSEKSSEISAEHKGTPWNDKGYVAWLLWGGDPAKAWTDKIIGQMEAADEKEKQSKQAAVVSRRYTVKRAFSGGRVFRSPKPFVGFRNVSQTDKATDRKPKGLWYACGTDWEDWCSGGPSQGGGFGERHLKNSPYRYNIEVNRSRMVFIHSKQDFYEFVRLFGEEDDFGDFGGHINWAKVAKEFDGIEICPNFPSLKYEYSWYQGWDVASGCIWGSGALRSVVPAEAYCGIKTASENEPTSPDLWAKVQALAKGEQASMTHGGKKVNGPNDGKGFTVFPSAYANGWASKTYKDLGGGWKKKAGPLPSSGSEDCDAMVSTAWVSPQGKMVFLRGQSHEDFAEKWALRNEPELHSRITEYAQTARPHASIWHRVLLDRGWLQLQGMSSIVVPPRPSRKQLQNVADFFANCIADGTSNPDRITLHIMGLDPSLRGQAIQPGENQYPFDVQERVSLADFIEREASGPVIEDMYESMMERTRRASLTEAWGPTLRVARGKAKKDVGHGGLDEWFSGHGGAKGKGEDATWGDWVSISPVTKTLPSGKKVEKGDIVGECGISDEADWKEITKGGEDPLKCMPRQKAHDTPKKERAEKAKAKQRAEKADSSRGKKPTMTPTFDKKKGKKARGYRQVPTKSLRLDPSVVRFLRQHGGVFKEYPNLWIKGGGARDALINFYADRAKGYQRSSRPLRDIDLVLIGGSHSDRDELLARFGGSVESEDLDTGARSMGGYLRSRDVGINEVALRPDFFVFTDKALRDLSRNTVNPSGGEVDPEWGDVSPRLGLRSVLFSLREGLDLPDNTMVTEAVHAARPFDLLIHLYKAFETGVEDSFFDAVSGNDNLGGARTAEEALLLLHQGVYSFSRTPAQEAIYQDAVMISDQDAWEDRGKKARLQRIQMKREASSRLRAAWGMCCD